MSETIDFVFDARLPHWKEPAYYGLYKTLEGAKAACEKNANGKKVKWSDVKGVVYGRVSGWDTEFTIHKTK